MKLKTVHRWVGLLMPNYGGFGLHHQHTQQRTLGLQQSGGWNTLGQTYLSFYASTGEILKNHNALAQPRPVRIVNFSHPMHTGKLGLWYKILLTISGLALFFLTLFGLRFYQKSVSKRASA